MTSTIISFELNAIAPWVAIAISIGALVYAVRRDRSLKNDTRITNLNTKIEAVDAKIDVVAESKAGKGTVEVLLKKVDVAEDNITRITGELKHLPDKDVTHRLEMAISEMRGEVRGLTERIQPIAAVADRVQEYALEKGFQR